jgi:hypothetical protein
MAQQATVSRIRSGLDEPQPTQWCGIGIEAVAAASIYCDGRKRKTEPAAGPVFIYVQPDYATD